MSSALWTWFCGSSRSSEVTTLVADIVAVLQLTANGTTEVVAQSVAAFKTEVDTHAQAFSTTDLQELNSGLDVAVQCVQCGLLASLQRAPPLEALAHDGLTLRSVGSFTTAAGAVTLAAPAPAVAALQQRRQQWCCLSIAVTMCSGRSINTRCWRQRDQQR